VDMSELFWDASVDELKRGYVYLDREEAYVCLVCGERFEKGIVYRDGDTFYEASKFASLHIVRAHGSMFEYLIGLDKKVTGLTDTQKKLMSCFYAGLDDKETMREVGAGSASTIRNHRFTLREKEKQAKLFLAMMDLINDGGGREPKASKLLQVHRTATALDERYVITEEESEQTIRKYFPDGSEGRMSAFPKKEKLKIVVLKHMMNRFESRRRYTEKEVNDILKTAADDYVTVRRYLVEYGFLDREEDGSAYWVKL